MFYSNSANQMVFFVWHCQPCCQDAFASRIVWEDRLSNYFKFPHFTWILCWRKQTWSSSCFTLSIQTGAFQNDKHIDVSFANYNGTARPGQLVVDTDNYSLWVGNANGYLNGIGGGTADTGDILFNGNDIYPNNSGYPQIYGGPFGGPELSYLEEAGNTASYSQTMYINNSGLTISLDYGGVQWNFNPDGTLSSDGTDGNITGANVVSANTFTSTGNVNISSGANTWIFYENGTSKTPVISVDDLPAPTTVGLRAIVNDSNLNASTNFGSQVGNLGSNVVPVFSDGANWLIG